jgi:hypothetical protein
MVHVVVGFPGCGGVLTAPSGDILSPSHPDRYREDMDCEWHIQLPVGERIRLTFLTFSLEDSQGCLFDFVAVSKIVIILNIWKLLNKILRIESHRLIDSLVKRQVKDENSIMD